VGLMPWTLSSPKQSHVSAPPGPKPVPSEDLCNILFPPAPLDEVDPLLVLHVKQSCLGVCGVMPF